MICPVIFSLSILIDKKKKTVLCQLLFILFFFSNPLIAIELKTRENIDHLALERIQKQHLGIPPVPFPNNNPPSIAKIQLGRKLFFDRRLSHNNTMSCAMCHVPEQGFTVNEIATAVGLEGQSLRRNAPTLLNVAFMGPIFHDGRETSLENQVIGPLLAADEMNNPSVGYLIEKIKRLDDYNGLFERAFGSGVGIENVGQALAAYERTLISANSSFDRWYYGKETDAFTAKEEKGFYLFTGKAKCDNCHLITEKYALFTDNDFHDTGLGWYYSMVQLAAKKKIRVQLAPGVFTLISREVVDSVGHPKRNDLGRYEVTLRPLAVQNTYSSKYRPHRSLHA
jgi:cytochrome c peroxidase